MQRDINAGNKKLDSGDVENKFTDSELANILTDAKKKNFHVLYRAMPRKWTLSMRMSSLRLRRPDGAPVQTKAI